MRPANAAALIAVLALLAAIAAVFYAFYMKGSTAIPLRDFPVGNIIIGNAQYEVFMANTTAEQMQGLMNVSLSRLESAGAIGMLFIFRGDSTQCFWMANTGIPLQQAWISNDSITYVYNATPLSTASVCYPGEYVLEIARGLAYAPVAVPGTRISSNAAR